MTETAPDHEWDLLRAIDPLSADHDAALLEPDYREDLFLTIIANDRPSPRRRGRRPSVWRASHRRRLWAAAGASGTLLTGAIVAGVVVLLSATAPAAYAGWTPDPSVPTAAELATATASCNRQNSINGPAVMTGTPVLTDQRGRFTAALFTNGTTVYDCLSDGTHTASGMNNALARLYARPSADQLELPDTSGGSLEGFMGGSAGQTIPAQWQAKLNSPRVRRDPRLRARLANSFNSQLSSEMERNAFGLAGSDVSAVSFSFADGTTVAATIQNGWYFAWWPSLNDPTSVTVTTSSGTVTSPMMPTGGQGPGCQFGAPGCVWAGLQPQPNSATATQTTTTATTQTAVNTATTDGQ